LRRGRYPPAFAGSFLLHPPDSIPRRAGHRFSTGVRFGPSQPYSRELLSPNYKCVPSWITDVLVSIDDLFLSPNYKCVPPLLSLSEGGFLVVELKTCHSPLIVAGEGIR